MYFKRIELQGFKSFAEPVSIEFNDGITCIVGPNGSGKSNISDAIRWVLGEQSPKMLRGGKMEEVIFAGTASRKSRGMAEVTLVIDNSSSLLPIDFSEVAITRRMFRSGESEYAINGSPCRLRDIRELIMDTGIGVDGYSLIGQGKIADIVSNKPESRREIFEEAAGVVMYRSKKAESERKLDAASQNLDRVNDIVTEIESRIGTLKEDSAKAAEYLGLRERYRELEINITLKNIENVELKNEYIADEIAEAESSIDEIKDEKAEIDQGVAAAREKAEVLDRLSGETQDKLLKTVEEMNLMVNRSQLSAEKLSFIEREEGRLAEEIEQLSERLSKEEKNAGELAKARTQIKERFRELSDDLRIKAGKFTEKNAQLLAKAEEIDSWKNELFSLQSRVSAKTSEISSLAGLKNTLDRRKGQILSEKEESQSRGEEIRSALSTLTRRREEEGSELAGIAGEKEALKAKYMESLYQEKKLAKELEEQRNTISQLSARKKTIEEMESNYEGYNGAVRFVMKANMPGVRGVVAELVEVPEGYEVAIETALGAALQNIVVNDDSAAQRAVGYLKENKAGRLTFLPIKSIRANGSRDRSLTGAMGFKGYGVECVAFDPEYTGIMEYLLGRVAIVDNLENAVKLSKSGPAGFRFVTLEGEIINASGAITGGAYKNRTANLLERKSEIAKLGEKIEELTAEKTKDAKKLEEIRSFIEKASEETARLDQRHREMEISLTGLASEMKSIENTLSEYENSSNKQERELASIHEEQAGADRMAEGMLREIEEAKAAIQSAENAAEAALTAHESLKEEIEKENEEITQARINLTSCENEKNNAENLAQRIQEAIAEAEGEKQKRENLLSHLLEDRRAILSGDTGSEEGIKKKEMEKAAIENYLEELTEEKTAAMRLLTESTKAKEALDETLSNLQMQKYELEIKKAKNETQLDAYKDKLWEEFEIAYIQAIEFKKRNFAMPAAVKESREIRSRIKELGEVNVGAIKEYETVGERYTFLTEQRADILSAMDSLKKIIEEMDRTIREKFKESFDKIVMHFEEVFQELFGGGTAELRLEDENRPLESGIEIIAQPPGKKLQNINLMSGGEKTMTAIAMMFAVLKAKPTPFCILDEIEAALDDANIDRFCAYLRQFKGIQFALVTHQKATMEHADVLYGVTMPEQGISKLISLKLGDEFEL